MSRSIGRLIGSLAAFTSATLLFLVPQQGSSQVGRLSLSPSSGAAGASFDIAGCGFAPNERVFMTWIHADGSAQSLATNPPEVFAESHGCISASGAVPHEARTGTHQVTGRGDVSRVQARGDYTVTSGPTATSAPPQTTNRPPTTRQATPTTAAPSGGGGGGGGTTRPTSAPPQNSSNRGSPGAVPAGQASGGTSFSGAPNAGGLPPLGPLPTVVPAVVSLPPLELTTTTALQVRGGEIAAGRGVTEEDDFTASALAAVVILLAVVVYLVSWLRRFGNVAYTR